MKLQKAGAGYSYLYDGKGNVTALLDSGGGVAASYQYDPFGNPMGSPNPLSQPMQFSTKAYDEKTGLSYYGYRFYAPGIGRWMTRDPIGEAGGINLYGFVGNNPVHWIDSFGLVPAIKPYPDPCAGCPQGTNCMDPGPFFNPPRNPWEPPITRFPGQPARVPIIPLLPIPPKLPESPIWPWPNPPAPFDPDCRRCFK